MEAVCRRCLLKDLTDGDYFRTVYDYIASLSEESKAPQGEYARRLALCMQCDHLVNGMCALCGCFVEARAAKAISHCAKGRSIW